MFITSVLDIWTLAVSAVFAIQVLRKKKSSGRLLVYFMFFFICILPLALDYIIGLPNYMLYNAGGRYNGFLKSYNDTDTRIIYDIFLIIAQIIILNCCKKKKYKFIFGKSKVRNGNSYMNIDLAGEVMNNKMRCICYAIALLPVLLTVVYGEYNILFVFGWRDYYLFDKVTNSGWYSFAEKLSYLGITASLLIILLKHEKGRLFSGFFRISAMVLLFMNLCIESKRSIIFFMLILIIAILLYLRKVDVKIIIIITVVFTSIVIAYSLFIKTTARAYSGFEGLYTSLRVDMFRDDTIKMCIYAMINPNVMKILDYPFQSYFTQIKYFFFIGILVGKFKVIDIPGIGFNKYLSTALIGSTLSAGYSFMTTSMFDEAIANFGVLGFFFAPWICARVALAIDRAQSLEKIFLIGSIVLAMMYSPNYILLYIECTFMIHIVEYIKLRSV